jgi:hypothetical protein
MVTAIATHPDPNVRVIALTFEEPIADDFCHLMRVLRNALMATLPFGYGWTFLRDNLYVLHLTFLPEATNAERAVICGLAADAIMVLPNTIIPCEECRHGGACTLNYLTCGYWL